MSLSWDLQPPTGTDPAVGEPGKEGFLVPFVTFCLSVGFRSDFSRPKIGLLWPKSDFSLGSESSLGENLVNPDLGEVGGPGEVGGDAHGDVGDLVVVLGLDVVVEGQDDSVGEPDDEDRNHVCFQLDSQIRTDFISLPFTEI